MITLITHKNWMRDEFTQNSAHKIVHSHGLDAPDTTQKGMGWWMPQAYAMRTNLYASKHNKPELPLIAPHENTLSRLPYWATKRQIVTMDANSASSPLLPWEGSKFWKLATAKTENFEPEIGEWSEVHTKLLSVPHNSIIQMSDPYLFAVEYRCFVLNHEVVTHSVYLREGVTVYDGAESSSTETREVLPFASDVAAWLQENKLAPTSYVLDVGLDSAGSLAVVELNPAWCSGWYDCDMDAVAETVYAASTSTENDFKWTPDPVIVRDYSNLGLWLR